MTEGSTGRSGGRDDGDCTLEEFLEAELDARDGTAFVHAGPNRVPDLRYCVAAAAEGDSGSRWGQIDSPSGSLETDSLSRSKAADGLAIAIAFDGDRWSLESGLPASAPADRLAGELADRLEGETLLTPARIPHDAALFLERQGFSLASTDVLARARAKKAPTERERIATAQRAAAAGIRRAASALAEATVEDGWLRREETQLTRERLRIAIDEGIVSAGGYPAGNTVVESGTDAGELRPGEPIVLEVAPREPTGYHGALARTLVVDADGGRERRAHVAVTQALRSARAMLTAGSESVTAVEADLEAEIRAFGEDGPIETRVSGLGLETAERPLEGSDDVEPGTIVRLEAATRLADGVWVRIADSIEKTADGAAVLEAPSRSLEPTTVLE
ncbi:M24 family metallopeptidase [Natrarchaeobius chitinivorans]|uniref:M24 family metallopeptidase n=1 Tax=Natrarchaeobius chitinivorans TaxID=1679083 RepID=A0A3N6PB29_NATCH|nr:M24 family metallopeptidase [Natrarchaeobius chitinivorans]RQG96399.1 M24 family metallopeptidase [Natrarchaeobius chitinivorans]